MASTPSLRVSSHWGSVAAAAATVAAITPIPLPAPGRRTLGRRSAPTRCAPCLLQPLDERVEAGREPFIAVVEPDVLAERRQGGEAVGGQGAEELVEPFPRRRVAEALLVERGRRAADREADGVVDQQEEGEARLVGGEPGIVQWCQERLGDGEGVRPQ